MFALCYLIFLILICSFIYPRKSKGRTATKTTFININLPLRWLQVIFRKKIKIKEKGFQLEQLKEMMKTDAKAIIIKILEHKTDVPTVVLSFLFYFI